MNPQEYINLARVEKDHWYYSGKRDLVRRLICGHMVLLKESRLLDCGAGTGIFAGEMASLCDVAVLDDHEESIRLLRERFASDRVLRVSGTQVPTGSASLDVVTALDVLEHIEKDAAAVGEFARITKPGGLVVVTVPASMALWSDWDVSLHHFRRYDKAGLRALFSGAEWEVLRCNYTNTAAFPAVWAIRRLRGKGGKQGEGARSEDKLPPRPLNWLLRMVFVWQGLCRLPMPFGVSLVLVARRR